MRRLRGRPRHDDVLTPREWEVLSLLREGLTNEQIAERLGVSFDTAKFHVSEIIGKLGVESRQEAAAWRGAPRGVPVPAAAPSAWQRMGLTSPVRVFAASMIATVAVGLLALAGGLILMSSRDGDDPAAPGVESRTGDEALDAMIESLLTGDAASLASRFAGVTAREGGVIGGPVGMFNVRDVPDTEWTSRLAGAQKSLHAVVQDPREPFAWWDQPASSLPRAAILEASRDFDIVLIVDEDREDGYSNPWRLSVVDGHVIDVVIDNGLQTPSGDRSQVPLARRLGYLTPSPDDEPGSFLIRPDERNVPPPPRRQPAGGKAPQPPPAPVSEPSTAPDGRTGETSLDTVIELLLLADLNTLRAQHDRLPALDEERGERVPARDWTNLLASASRTLYAVYTSDPLDAEIALDVSTATGAIEKWKFGVEDDEVVEVTLRSRSLPRLDREYARFYVVPSPQAGPLQPPNHPLSVRSGDQDIDRLLSVLQTRDANALQAVLAAPSDLVVRDGQDCRGGESYKDAAFAKAWAADTSSKAHGIHAVIAVPEGYQPPGDHLIILITQENPFSWKAIGLLEQQGRVVLLITAVCQPERLYPPTNYLLPPPAGGLNAVSESRRSGIAIVDAVLNAAATGNETAMAGLISYRSTPCSQPEIGVLPCPPGTATGTVLDALSISACHGGYALPAEAPKQLIEIASAGLYAVIEAKSSSVPSGVGPPPEEEDTRVALLYSPARGAVAITIGNQGVTGVRSGCFIQHPEWLVDNAQPNFLLPPP